MRRTHFIPSILFCFVASFVLIQPVQAEDTIGIGVGGKVSSLGVGGEVVGRLHDNLNMRVGLQGIAYDRDDTYSGIDYEAELEFFSGILLADWFPFSNNFRVSGGVAVNQNELNVTGVPRNGTFTIGGTTYPSALAGSLTGTVDFNTVAPYAGIGYGGSFSDTSNWSFFCDLGILFQGSPNVSYSATGPLASNPTFQANLEQERKELEEDIDEYQYYPVVSMGVMYKF